jgi:PD-(D/E)XK endonuclease
MAPLKQKGDHAELEVARDLVRRGYRIAIPYGEDWDFDLIFQRPDSDALERVQVKHTRSDGYVVAVPCYSHSLTNGRVRQTKHYTAATIDWLAVYDAFTDRCFYVPAAELGPGRSRMHLRLRPTRNGQSVGIRHADDYSDPRVRAHVRMKVEPAGLEPAPSRMQTARSPN